MVGYVLLISFAVIMGVIVYNWLKTYIPREALQCPEGVSVFIRDISCEDLGNGNYTLYLNLTNNGRFDFDGFFIKATRTPEQTIATWDIAPLIISGGNEAGGVVRLSQGALEPAEIAENIKFELNNKTYIVEILPIKYQIIDGKQKLAGCGEAKVQEDVVC